MSEGYVTTPAVDGGFDLTTVSGIGKRKAGLLRDAGYESIADLQRASQADLADVDGIGRALAARIKAHVGSPQT